MSKTPCYTNEVIFGNNTESLHCSNAYYGARFIKTSPWVKYMPMVEVDAMFMLCITHIIH